MSNSSNIKFVFIGNLETKQIITEFIVIKNDQTKNDSNLIFNKISSSGRLNYNERNKLQLNNGYGYFINYPTSRFYLVVAEPSYPERTVFEMIDNIDKENVFLLTTEKGDLNPSGKQSLKAIVDKYQDINKVNKIKELNEDVNQIKSDMSQNIKKVTDNILKVQDLDEKAYKIRLNADSFKNDAKKLERITCWQNCKWTIILVSVVVILLLIFVVPYIWKS